MDPISRLRREYTRTGFDESDAAPDPIEQFRGWFDDALAAELNEPNAMTLAMTTPEGLPSARFILFKGLDEWGFIFFTI